MDRPEEAIVDPVDVATLAARGRRVSRQALVAASVITTALYALGVLAP